MCSSFAVYQSTDILPERGALVLNNRNSKKHIKGTRVNEAMLREISRIIRDEVKDPDIPDMTSVTSVSVTGDLRYATIYVSIYGDAEVKEKAMAALKKASPFIRSRAACGMNMRYTPEMRFVLDDAIEYGVNMISKINKLMSGEKADEE